MPRSLFLVTQAQLILLMVKKPNLRRARIGQTKVILFIQGDAAGCDQWFFALLTPGEEVGHPALMMDPMF